MFRLHRCANKVATATLATSFASLVPTNGATSVCRNSSSSLLSLGGSNVSSTRSTFEMVQMRSFSSCTRIAYCNSTSADASILDALELGEEKAEEGTSAEKDDTVEDPTIYTGTVTRIHPGNKKCIIFSHSTGKYHRSQGKQGLNRVGDVVEFELVKVEHVIRSTSEKVTFDKVKSIKCVKQRIPNYPTREESEEIYVADDGATDESSAEDVARQTGTIIEIRHYDKAPKDHQFAVVMSTATGAVYFCKTSDVAKEHLQNGTEISFVPKVSEDGKKFFCMQVKFEQAPNDNYVAQNARDTIHREKKEVKAANVKEEAETQNATKQKKKENATQEKKKDSSSSSSSTHRDVVGTISDYTTVKGKKTVYTITVKDSKLKLKTAPMQSRSFFKGDEVRFAALASDVKKANKNSKKTDNKKKNNSDNGMITDTGNFTASESVDVTAINF